MLNDTVAIKPNNSIKGNKLKKKDGSKEENKEPLNKEVTPITTDPKPNKKGKMKKKDGE